ncbi:MAG: hypothetical protein AB7P40_22775 [Chloroflexota bacterium]
MSALAPASPARIKERMAASSGRRSALGAWSLLSGVLPGILVGTGLLLPLAILTVFGLSVVGLSEESTGYRYFYSLRTLYTPDERPRLPQGQLVTVAHMGLQLVLTALGYPPEQITPRIDLFALAGAALPHLATAAALTWAVLPLRSLAARTAVAGFVLMVATDGAYSGFHLVIPDYYSWQHALGLASLGCCLRISDERWQLTRGWMLGLGVLVGACLALKLTLVAFVVPPVLLAVWRSASVRDRVRLLATIGGVGCAVLVVVTLLAYGGSLEAVARHVATLARFGATQGDIQASPPGQAFGMQVLESASPVLALSLVLPLVVAVSAIRRDCRALCLALLAGSVLSLAVAAARFLPTTLIEVGDLALLVGIVWLSRVGGPAISGLPWQQIWRRRQPLLAGRPAAALAALVILTLGGWAAYQEAVSLVPAFQEAERIQHAVDQFVGESPGQTAILTLDNAHRPLTRDGAIFKGGTNSGESSLWGVSPYVQHLVPNRHYFLPSPELPDVIDTSPFSRLLFVSLEGPGRLDVTEHRLAETFGASLIGFECPLQEVREIAGGIQYGCRRLPDGRIDEYHGEIAYVTENAVVAAGGPVERPAGPPRPLAPGEAVYSEATGEIWRLDGSGTFTRLVGSPGQETEIDAIGEWSERKQELTGMVAHFDGTRWNVGSEERHPVNKNATLRLREDGGLRGWDVLDREGVTVERSDTSAGGHGDDPEDGWLAVRSHEDGARVGLRTSVDASDLHGAPLIASVLVRGLGQGHLMVRLGNVTVGGAAASGPAPPSSAIERPETGSWQDVTLALPPEQVTADRIELVVELVGAQSGGGLDVQHAEILAGRFPAGAGQDESAD